MYDHVLNIHFQEGVHTVAYADDLALIVLAKNSDKLVVLANLILVGLS